MITREISVNAIGGVNALHRLFGSGPEPTPEEDIERRLHAGKRQSLAPGKVKLI